MEIQVINAFAGRLRLRIPRLRNDPTYASKIENKVKELNFITSVRVNPIASSLVVTYAKTSIAASEAKSRLLAAIACLDRPQNEPSTLLEAKSVPENSVLQKLDLQQQELHSEEIALETASESPSQFDLHEIDSLNHSEQIESLPDEITSSMAAEPTPEPAEVSVAASEEESVSIVSSVKSEENDSIKPNFTPACKGIGISHRELARRLGISSRAIAIWRSKPNFTQWSMTKDPEQIGWVYIKPLNKFYAVIEKYPRIL
ncbi:hypothetical protein NIES593_17485 [Hydrococcus rivularis NIES-593]|uniref:Uncharacterized protein n=1 Tax=Hydrococcus rivularis NIES-593 TaxID=1921803 RepID=A0A1U7HB46_9CYAN|nr:heavy-metal-associated domain-containing protein [Hydrococcus rivularis]OKH20803.1 hypothetical protein NIES593_17485 [Hydrococcus rivularis NIES-593]